LVGITLLGTLNFFAYLSAKRLIVLIGRDQRRPKINEIHVVSMKLLVQPECSAKIGTVFQ